MIAPTHWIKRNMMGTYSEKLGRPLTEAELRVQRCLEQMSVPDWYQKYSRPSKFLKNDIPFECRPASWKTYKKSKNNNNHTPKKTGRKKSFRNSPNQSPRKSESESSRTSTADSGFNDTYRVSHRSPKEDKKNASYSTSHCSSSGSESDSPRIESNVPLVHETSSKSLRSSLNISNSYPRVSRSRKIENINIVFSKPFPAQSDRKLDLEVPSSPPVVSKKASSVSTPKTVYTMTKNIEMEEQKCEESPIHEKTHTSFLIADVEPSGVTTRVQVFAGPLTSDSSGSSDEDLPRRCSPSPHTKFFNSSKKSTALEKIVQTKRADAGRSFIQEIIEELDRSTSSNSSAKYGCFAESIEPLSPEAQSFVKSMVSALEQSCYISEEDDQQSNISSDSDLAKSTSISFKSYDSADDRPSSPLPASSSAGDYCSSGDDAPLDEEVFWIPCKPLQLPRTSSQLSMMSKGSSRSGQRRAGQNSPGLSPIKMERREDWLLKQAAWGMTYNTRDKASSRQLFRIDETGIVDSGYSDRSTTASSRTATLTSVRSSRSSSTPTSSASSSPTLEHYESSRLPLSESGAFIMKSFLV